MILLRKQSRFSQIFLKFKKLAEYMDIFAIFPVKRQKRQYDESRDFSLRNDEEEYG